MEDANLSDENLEFDCTTLGIDDENTRSKTDETSNRKKRSRGPTIMIDVTRIRSAGEKKLVEYNDDGVPIGVNGAMLKSFIGSCVHHHIPITYASWNHVPVELKEKIYNMIEVALIIDSRSKKDILRTAGIAFRQFKSWLTRKHILPFKDQPKILLNPPAMYSHIERYHWLEFVSSRLSAEFEGLRSIQQGRRAKNKYNHRLSRKGYANLVEEMKKTSSSESDFGRANLWKKARTNKNGEYDNENVQQVVNRIDEILKNDDPLSNKHPSPNDALTQALGTPEYAGRVRGVGAFITPTAYFHIVKRSSKQEMDKNKELQVENRALHRRIRELEDHIQNTRFTPISEQGSCSKQVLEDDNEFQEKQTFIKDIKSGSQKKQTLIKGKSCMLALGNIKNIVASGVLLENDGLESTIHGIPLGDDNVRVSIDVVIANVALTIKIRDDLTTIKQAVGSHVPWPRHLVIINEERKDNVSRKLIEEKEVISAPISNLPISLKSILRFAEKVMADETSISFQLPVQLFGFSRKSYVLREDVIDFCNMRKVKTLSMVAYMVCLHSYLLDSNRVSQYIFVDPSLISAGQNTPEIRARNLCSRLMTSKQNQLVIAPYNPGGHWSLIVINAYDDMVYYLDSLRTSSREDLKYITDMAIAIFRSQKNLKKTRKATFWKIVKCPLQVGSVECGYYVMRYMRDILINKSTLITDVIDTRTSYSQLELDEVRVEWAELLGRYI